MHVLDVLLRFRAVCAIPVDAEVIGWGVLDEIYPIRDPFLTSWVGGAGRGDELLMALFTEVGDHLDAIVSFLFFEQAADVGLTCLCQ